MNLPLLLFLFSLGMCIVSHNTYVRTRRPFPFSVMVITGLLSIVSFFTLLENGVR